MRYPGDGGQLRGNSGRSCFPALRRGAAVALRRALSKRRGRELTALLPLLPLAFLACAEEFLLVFLLGLSFTM